MLSVVGWINPWTCITSLQGGHMDKRAHHNALERRRRDHIKDSFHGLRDSIPSLHGEKVLHVPFAIIQQGNICKAAFRPPPKGFFEGNPMSTVQCVQNSSVKLSFTSLKVSLLLLIFNKCLQLLSFVSCLCRFPAPTFWIRQRITSESCIRVDYHERLVQLCACCTCMSIHWLSIEELNDSACIDNVVWSVFVYIWLVY